MRQCEGGKRMCSSGRNDPAGGSFGAISSGHLERKDHGRETLKSALRVCFKRRLFLEPKLNFRNPELKE